MKRYMNSAGACVLVAGVVVVQGGCVHMQNSRADQGQSSAEAASTDKDAGHAAGPTFSELFEHVRVDVERKVVEFDADISPVMIEDERSPLVYLEVLVCIPNTREHESILVSKARPSHVHAALLAIGATAGKPGGFTFESGQLKTIDATGPGVSVECVYDGLGRAGEVRVDPLEWVVNAADGQAFGESDMGRSSGFVFAGSKFVNVNGQEHYGGDLGGNVIGLTTFGDEVIGLSKTISPEAAVQAPEWVAKLKGMPGAGTPVRVRISLK